MMRSAVLVALLSVGCGRVVFDESAEVDDTSSSGPTSSGDGGGASSPGSPAGGGADGSAGNGGSVANGSSAGGAAPVGATSAGTGGAGGGEPLEACGALAWTGEALRHWRNDDDLGPLHVTAWQDLPGEPARDGARVRVAYSKEHDDDGHFFHDFDLRSWLDDDWSALVDGYDFAGEAPRFVTLGEGPRGTATWVREDQIVPVVTETSPPGESLGGWGFPEPVRDVRALTFAHRGGTPDEGTYAAVHGDPWAPQLAVMPRVEGGPAIAVELASCADRPVPLALVASGEGFVVAHAGASCAEPAGPPTRVDVAVVTREGSVSARTTIDVGEVVETLQLAADGSRVWLAVRGEGSDRLDLRRLAPDLAPAASEQVPVAAARGVAIASHPLGLIVVDVGPHDAAHAPVQVQLLGDDLALRASSAGTPAGVVDPTGRPAVAVRQRDGAVLVAAFAHDDWDQPIIAGLRLGCTAP